MRTPVKKRKNVTDYTKKELCELFSYLSPRMKSIYKKLLREEQKGGKCGN